MRPEWLFDYAEVPKDQNPIDGTLQVELNLLGDWLGVMLEQTGVEITTAELEAAPLDLERCSKSAIAELFVRLYGFNDLIEIAFDIENFADYMAFVAAHIALAKSAVCGDAAVRRICGEQHARRQFRQ